MARIRSISPELRTSETCAEWTREARYAWVLLWGYLDDHGRGIDNAKIIAADCFPLDDDVTAALMGEWLDLFEAAGSICRYEYENKRYMHATKWGHWQKPQHPSKVRIPPCPEHEPAPLLKFEGERQKELMKVSGNPHEDLGRVSPTSKEGEGELSRRGSAPAVKPQKPPRCSRHSSSPNPPACGPCKELRLAWEAKDNLERPALTVVPKALACPDHRGQLAGTCSNCAADRKAVG